MKNEYIVGVSGHRDLNQFKINDYKKEIREILYSINEKIKKEYKNLIILSPLADGADRLIVEVAIELSLEYKVLLPLPKEIYKKDFNNISQKKFEYLLNEAKTVETIELCDDCTIENVSDYNEYRDKQYKKVGEIVVEKSDFMLFLWDSIDNGKTGGTADIYKYAKKLNKQMEVIKVERDNIAKEPLSNQDKLDIIIKMFPDRYLSPYILARFLDLGRIIKGDVDINILKKFDCNSKKNKQMIQQEIKKVIQNEIRSLMKKIIENEKKLQYEKNYIINIVKLENTLKQEAYNKAIEIFKEKSINIDSECLKEAINSIYESGKSTIYYKNFIKDGYLTKLCDYFNFQSSIWDKDYYNKKVFENDLKIGLFDKPNENKDKNEINKNIEKKRILGEYQLLTDEEKKLLQELNKKLNLLANYKE